MTKGVQRLEKEIEVLLNLLTPLPFLPGFTIVSLVFYYPTTEYLPCRKISWRSSLRTTRRGLRSRRSLTPLKLLPNSHNTNLPNAKVPLSKNVRLSSLQKIVCPYNEWSGGYRNGECDQRERRECLSTHNEYY
jgi:hypothetical protein